MAHKQFSEKQGVPANVEPLVYLWLLRMLVPLNGHRDFICRRDFSNDTTAEMLGLERWIDPEGFDFDPKAVRNELRALHRSAEGSLNNSRVSAFLGRNIARLARLASLSVTDCRLLEFAVMIKSDKSLDDIADNLGQLSSIKTQQTLSVVLNLPENDIRQSLSRHSALARSGLLTLDRSGSNYLPRKLELLSSNFADNMLSSDVDAMTLLRATVSLCSAPLLTLKDYQHLASELGILQPYLQHSLATGREGVNVFLHGDPGTGKTQLVKALASALECELFEVTSEDEDGDPIDGPRRLMAFRAAQSFFARRKSIILFDEVQDVFDDGDGLWGKKSTAQTHKAWINRMLEQNPVPTFWLSNSAHQLDTAFIRRFDMVVELPVPPRQQRQRIVGEACGEWLDTKTIDRVAAAEKLAPAVVARAASVVNSIKDTLGTEGVGPAFELIVSNTLETQGHARIASNDVDRLPETYDPNFINADGDIAGIAMGLKSANAGRLCLYGPPGTGKTAYARWLAEQLEAPLLVKRASDLMSMWSGEMEKNLARAFKQAEAEHAILLIDEADSFLQDRRGARANWEISQVNEMLTQMESFGGIFIASTNLLDSLDQAALRRFDLKLKFGFLSFEQTWLMLQRHCTALQLSPPDKALKRSLQRVDNATPGDFAAIARRHQFSPLKSANEIVDALIVECDLKEGAKRSIGFM